MKAAKIFFKAVIRLRRFLVAAFFLFSVCSASYADSPYTWYTFNIPPFGSVSERGIGYVLANSYFEAGMQNKIILANPARWYQDMLNPQKNKFCSTGSWMLPNTDHRVYSDSIINTVDYGVAVRPELFRKLSKNGRHRVVSVLDVIHATKSAGYMLILKDRPVFGDMAELIEQGKQESNTKITYMTASEGPVSMLKMANISNRNIDSVLIFPEEFPVFEKQNPNHSLEYLMLSEGSNFAPIRASCPNTKQGQLIIATVNMLLKQGLREKVFSLFLEALPDIKEIREQALLNQRCISDDSCKDPLVDSLSFKP